MYNNIFSGIAALSSAFLIFFIIFVLLILAVLVFQIIVTWKMYEKADKPGWAAIVPIYNKIVLFDIIGYKWYYIFLLLLGCIPTIGSFVLLLFSIHYNIKLAKSYGQSVGFGIGLCFLPVIFVAMIAFKDDIDYVAPAVNGDIDFNDLF